MNRLASLELGFTPHPKENEIFIDSSLKGKLRKQVIAHEKIEAWHMKHRKLKYRSADAIAEGLDKIPPPK